MKTNRNSIVFIIVLLLGFILFGCKKAEQETVSPKIAEEHVEVTGTSASFSWSVEWVGKRISVVEVSDNEDMNNSQFYGSEEELNKTDFRATANNLKPATLYYYRYWVWNQNFVNNKFVMEEKTFKTSTGVPNVKTVEVKDVTRTTARVVGEVTEDNGATVTERGVCWSTSHNPTLSDAHKSNGSGLGTFTTEISNLRASQVYYVRAYAKNSNGAEYGEELSFVTGEAGLPEIIIQSVTVNTASVTVSYNVVSDGGTSVTTHGVCWSTSPNPEYTGQHTNNGNGTGMFVLNMTGLSPETAYHVRVYAINSVGTSYSDDHAFTTSSSPQAPTGAVNGQFSVSETKKVWFSKGNLQYIGSASTPYWRFAEKQWDVIGNGDQASSAPNVDRDLFGWGTSGYHDSADPNNVNYQPYSTSSSTVNSSYNYYGYGPSINQSNPSLTGTQYDWGLHNPISNGGYWAGAWRTLTKDEWTWLFETRQTSTVNGTPNARYAKGRVNSVYGVILFPDNYTHPSGVTAPFGINDTGNTGWNYNSYSAADWAKMEENGCVFLPAAGYRSSTILNRVGQAGYYWSTSYISKSNAYRVAFDETWMVPEDSDRRYYGLSVRLVRTVY